MRGLFPVLLAPLVLVVLGAAGCGADTEARNAYVDAVNRSQTRFARTFERLATRITPTSAAAQDARTLEGFQRAVGVIVGDLRAIEVPEQMRAPHDQLVGAVGRYGDEIRRARAAFASSDRQKVVAAQNRLRGAIATVSARIDAAIAAINRKLRE